jgi:hypothetical protein
MRKLELWPYQLRLTHCLLRPAYLGQFECHLKANAKKLNPHVFETAPQKTKQRRLSGFEIACPKIEQ